MPFQQIFREESQKNANYEKNTLGGRLIKTFFLCLIENTDSREIYVRAWKDCALISAIQLLFLGPTLCTTWLNI
jgi:hypothetical protein